MRRGGTDAVVMVATFSIGAAFLVAVLTFKIWLFGSLITSSIKSLSNKCGTQYAVEGRLINGNWFCKTK